jgi:hypothetical protein
MSQKQVSTLVSIMKAYAWKNFQRMAYLVVTGMSELPSDVPVATLVDVCNAMHAFLIEIYQTRTIVQYDDIMGLCALAKARGIRIDRTFHRMQMSLGITDTMCTTYITPDENNRIMHESFRRVLRSILSSRSQVA